jgi:hypothetical protein
MSKIQRENFVEANFGRFMDQSINRKLRKTINQSEWRQSNWRNKIVIDNAHEKWDIDKLTN